MVKVTKHTKTTVEVPVSDLRRALRLPSWGRFTLGGVMARTGSNGEWNKLESEVVPQWNHDSNEATVIFTNEQSKTKSKRLR